MMDVQQVRHWLESLDSNDEVGIDEGGLSLRIVRDGILMDEYCEVGGIPEEVENA